MRIRKALAATVGILQSIIAVLTMGFACTIYFDLFDVQISWKIPAESVLFSVLVLLGFGLFSLISGFFLIDEWIENH